MWVIVNDRKEFLVVLRPQGPSLIAAITETFVRKKIAAELGPFGRNSLSAVTAVRLMVLRPQPKDSYGCKMRQ